MPETFVAKHQGTVEQKPGGALGEHCNCRAQAELDLLGKRLGHDLRAPLRAISIIPQWIAEDMDEAGTPVPPPIADHLQTLESQAKRMDSLLVGVLEFIKVANADQPRELISTEMEIARVLEDLAPAYVAFVEIAPQLASLWISRSDFVTVLRQLISNSVIHCDAAETRISCIARQVGQTAVFDVADNGTGIDESDHSKIFEPFTTLQPRDKVDTSGLGLAIVRKIVTSWGGSVSAVAQDAGGVTMRFQFPIQPCPENR